MFKLTKIIGGRTNVPEFTKLKTEEETVYTKGCLYFYEDGIARMARTDENCMLFICTETLPNPGTGREYVTGYFVTHDMVFETNIDGGIGIIPEGGGLSFSINGNTVPYAVCATPGNDAKLISNNDYENTGRVIIQIRCW